MNQPTVIRADAVEEAIRRHTGRRHCLLVGRGTTAIHLALRAVERSSGRGEIILPTIGCASIAQTVWYAGFRPIFADADLDTFTISVESVERKLTADTKAIMPVHIFGHAAPMARITALAAERDVFVIEDAAQAAGGVCDGQPMGAHGDFSVLSFSGGKIIRADAGGAPSHRR
jgi:perosamine synthetase